MNTKPKRLWNAFAIAIVNTFWQQDICHWSTKTTRRKADTNEKCGAQTQSASTQTQTHDTKHNRADTSVTQRASLHNAKHEYKGYTECKQKAQITDTSADKDKDTKYKRRRKAQKTRKNKYKRKRTNQTQIQRQKSRRIRQKCQRPHVISRPYRSDVKARNTARTAGCRGPSSEDVGCKHKAQAQRRYAHSHLVVADI